MEGTLFSSLSPTEKRKHEEKMTLINNTLKTLPELELSLFPVNVLWQMAITDSITLEYMTDGIDKEIHIAEARVLKEVEFLKSMVFP